MSQVRPEVLFAVIYAVFLLGISYLLRWRARRMVSWVGTEPSWTHGLAANFRSGLAATLLILTAFILFSAGWRFHKPMEVTVLLLMGAWIGFEGFRIYRTVKPCGTEVCR